MSESSPAHRGPEWLLLLVLATVQFTNIVDFMIVMPLGPQLMRVFAISPAQFGLMVSAYTFSASVFGFLGAFFIDRFDRKAALLTLYAGFALGTLLCALAPTYELFVGARVVAGAFGGIMGALVYAIVGDAIPAHRRGAAMGKVMAAFSIASVLGVPMGLTLANWFGWHAPFIMLAGLSLLVLLAGLYAMPSMTQHLTGERRQPLADIRAVLTEPNHLRAFTLTVTLMFGGFTVIPFISPYLVANVGLTEAQLTYVYLAGGAVTLFTAPLAGRLADRLGKYRVFAVACTLAVLPILALTNLPVVPVAVAIAVTTAFMVLTTARGVTGMAMVTEGVAPRYRGGFMSINSAVQHMASGMASAGAALLVTKTASGTLTGYSTVGLIAAMASLLTVVLGRKLKSLEKPTIAGSPLPEASA